jgi:hypothetical protein
MTTRRGFLQSVGAALGSTVLPAGAVATVATAAPVAEVATGVMAAAAVVRQFKTAMVIDAKTLEPCLAVAVTENDETHYLQGRTPLDTVKIGDKTPLEFIDNSTPERRQESKNLLDVVVIREQLERLGMPPLTDFEAALLMAREGKTA